MFPILVLSCSVCLDFCVFPSFSLEERLEHISLRVLISDALPFEQGVCSAVGVHSLAVVSSRLASMVVLISAYVSVGDLIAH